jgi:hypothetical protein
MLIDVGIGDDELAEPGLLVALLSVEAAGWAIADVDTETERSKASCHRLRLGSAHQLRPDSAAAMLARDAQALDLRCPHTTGAVGELPAAQAEVQVADRIVSRPGGQLHAFPAVLRLEPFVVLAGIAGEPALDQ